MSNKTIKGKVIKFGDDVNTDVIAPGRWHRQGMDILRLHTMEAIRPEFCKAVEPGDILVAGKNFGCGSHRESATAIMKFLGISAIVADSIARLYYRNCIAFGIPIFGIDGVSENFVEGDEIEIVIGPEKVTVRNAGTGREAAAPPIPDTMSQILEAGGVYNLLKKRLEEEQY